MGADTKIQWCHHTFNPWWGCVEAGPECDSCYARTFAHRLGLKLWGHDADRRFFGDAHWREPLKWNRQAAAAGERRRVFCSSMADVLEDRRDLDAPRARLWDLIEATPNLDWMLLSKRPSKFATLTPERWHRAGWPQNVWAGTSAGTQRTADVLIPQLVAAAAGARVRFISGEPLLEAVDYRPHLEARADSDAQPIHLLILGGESGPKARPLNVAWMRSAVSQCRKAGVAPFCKQVGSFVVDRNDAGFEAENETWAEGPDAGQPTDPRAWPTPHGGVEHDIHGYRDDYQGADVRVRLRDGHGGDPTEWPLALRVREMPGAAA